MWKTKIGKIFGCPPDYSGKWKGYVTRTKKGSPDEEDRIDVEVIIEQSLYEVEWRQTGFDKEGNIITESKFVIGEVLDDLGKWSAICGVYEVLRKDKGNTKHDGSQLVNVSQDGKSMSGSYCSNNGNAGDIELTKE